MAASMPPRPDPHVAVAREIDEHMRPGFTDTTINDIGRAFQSVGRVRDVTITISVPQGLGIAPQHLAAISEVGMLQMPTVMVDGGLPENTVSVAISAKLISTGVLTSVYCKRFSVTSLGHQNSFVRLINLSMAAMDDFWGLLIRGDTRATSCVLVMVFLIISAPFCYTRIPMAVMTNILAGYNNALPSTTATDRREQGFLNGAGVGSAIAAALQGNSVYNGEGPLPEPNVTFVVVQFLVGLNQFFCDVTERWGASVAQNRRYELISG